ncbi:MAG: hypothetical protein J7518_10080 [Nocardioidaceae bacterium]|nr:hypothetical protein [Nocardioidaceae bacterium]
MVHENVMGADDLWGGRLTELVFNPQSHTCELSITAVDGGKVTDYRVTCTSVTDLHFRNSIPGLWTFADVTEVHEELMDEGGSRRLDIMLWSEEAGISIVCATVDVEEVQA